MRKRMYCFGFLAVILVFFSACGEATPGATPTPTRTPAPKDTPVPTSTTMPTPTLTPTANPLVMTPFPPDINPLTGMQVADVALLERIPTIIKVSNSPEVRPQSGLNSADMVFEHFAEGGITRFSAVFYGTDVERVGSVRSGRLIDQELPAMFGAIFGYSGSSAGVKESFRSSDLFPERIAAPDFGVGEPYFYRVPQEGKAFEHTLFTNPEVLRQLAEERGINQRPDYQRFLAFSDVPAGDATPVDYFEVNYLTGMCTAEWTYNATTGLWGRYTAGQMHSDYLTGEQLTAANVIIVYAHHVETDILEDTWGGGHMSIQIQFWNTGPALIFRDGQMISGYWERNERNHMPTFWSSEGVPVPLKPGNTWFQLVPLDTQSDEFETGKLRFIPEGIVPFRG